MANDKDFRMMRMTRVIEEVEVEEGVTASEEVEGMAGDMGHHLGLAAEKSGCTMQGSRRRRIRIGKEIQLSDILY